jgi:hypothetical protein
MQRYRWDGTGFTNFPFVFACANPRPQANELAKRLAAAVLK